MSQSNSRIEKNIEQSGIFWLFCAVVFAVACTLALTTTEAFSQSATVIEEGESSPPQVLSGDDNTLTNNGAITAPRGIGISSVEARATIINSETGTISAHTGVLSRGLDARITNRGTIEARQTGVLSRGLNARISNSGTIETSGGGGGSTTGIYSISDNAMISNSGRIETGGLDSEGIYSDAANAMISNSGTIIATGTAISTHGRDATVTNSGTISTTGVEASGILMTGDDGAITNSGAISTSGDRSDGIFSRGLNTRISNSGTISTSGTFGDGIATLGNSARISNSGTISTSGDGSAGIFSRGLNAMITNSGSITTGGSMDTTSRGTTYFSDGISSHGDSAMITNSGSISTTGMEAHGIFSTGDNAMITNSGTIETSGDDSVGIFARGTDTEITISGSVSATGAGSYAVQGSNAGDQTLTLLSRAHIRGKIDLGEKVPLPLNGAEDSVFVPDNDIVNIITNAAARSRTYTIEGADTFNLGELAVRNDNTTVAVIDPTGSSAERMVLGSAAGQIRQLVFQRLAQRTRTVGGGGGGGGGGDAGGTTRGVWGALFGTGSKRDDDGLALAWSSNRFGAVGGYDIRLDSSYRVGLFAGGSRGHIETDVRSIETDTNSGFIGTYGQRILGGGWDLSGSVIIGYESHNSSRTVFDNIAGDETADGDYGSFYVSPSLDIAWSHELGNGLEFRPDAQIAYTYGHYSGYTESGTANSDLRFDGRNVNIFDSRLQLALAQSFSHGQGEIEWRGGATFTHYGDDNVDVSLGRGDSISYRVPGDETIPAGMWVPVCATSSGTLST